MLHFRGFSILLSLFNLLFIPLFETDIFCFILSELSTLFVCILCFYTFCSEHIFCLIHAITHILTAAPFLLSLLALFLIPTQRPPHLHLLLLPSSMTPLPVPLCLISYLPLVSLQALYRSQVYMAPPAATTRYIQGSSDSWGPQKSCA